MHDETIELRDMYLANPVRALLMKLTLPLRQRALFKYRNHTLQEVLDEFFESEELKAVIGQFWVYHGPPPSEQWALINMVASYSYMLNGGWQFKGTSQALSNAYAERIVELGGTIETDTRVTRILIEGEHVRGVETHGGERYTSRYVVSNADPYQTFFKLLGEEHTPPELATRIRSMKPSNSFAGVYLGLDVPISHFGVEEYEVCYNSSLDTDAMYQAMMEGRWKDGLVMLTLYSNLPDPTYAPAGKSVVTLTTYSDIGIWSADPEIYQEQKEQMAADLIGMAENVMPGLGDHVEVMETMSPRTIARYTWNHRGVPYGWSFTPEQQRRLPIPTGVGGLFMAGAWTWPSSSVSMTQLAGYLCARLIIEEENGNLTEREE
jgi:prolycopene isomerase